jgi:hypothetical protein
MHLEADHRISSHEAIAHADGGCREVIDKMQDSVQKSSQMVAPEHGVRYIGRLAC